MQVQREFNGISYQLGYQILENRGVAIVGISPGNSYFKQALITELIDFTSGLFSKVYIIAPDKPFVHTLTALGHSPAKAQKYARIQGNDIKRRITKSLEAIAQKKSSQSTQIFVLDWQTDVEPSAEYQAKLQYISQLYKTNKEFYQDTLAEVRAVIEGNSERKITEITTGMLEEGAQYRLKEFAFLLASPALLKSNDIAKIYHKKWPLWDRFCDGHYVEHSPIIGSVVIS